MIKENLNNYKEQNQVCCTFKRKRISEKKGEKKYFSTLRKEVLKNTAEKE